jgi:hypothetical protein
MLSENGLITVTLTGVGAHDFREEKLDLVHEIVVIETGTVPLEHRELGIVAGAALLRSKRLTNLEDGTRPRRNEPLHGELRGRLQETLPRSNAVDKRVGHCGVTERGCFHLDDATGVEKAADAS